MGGKWEGSQRRLGEPSDCGKDLVPMKDIWKEKRKNERKKENRERRKEIAVQF